MCWDKICPFWDKTNFNDWKSWYKGLWSGTYNSPSCSFLRETTYMLNKITIRHFFAAIKIASVFLARALIKHIMK